MATGTDGDILLVGAGLAGLSLAVALVDAGVTDRRIVLLDPRTEFARDRTWCYWDVAPHPFQACVTHRWHRWAAGEAVVDGGSVAYCHVPADRFYAAALGRLRSAPNVDLRLGCRVSAVHDGGDHVTAVTDAGPVHGSLAFDSRPTPPSFRPGDVALVQQFVGLFVRADRPTFDPSTVRLMDFTPAPPGSIRFAYVLPFSRTEALVEATAIDARPVSERQLERDAHDYLRARFGLTTPIVVARERGRLPMTTAPLTPRRSPRVTAVGLTGGMAKPSTGYAFLAVQRWSAAMAARVAAGGVPVPPPGRSAKAVLLDRVFLSYLRRRPAVAPALFADLFAAVLPDALARFLSDAGSPADDARVIAALPKLPFLTEAVRSHKLWLPRPSMRPSPSGCPGGRPATAG